MSVNKVILVGFVGKDPEIRTFENRNKVASFTLATSENYTNKQGEKVENTEWHNIQVFNKTADFVETWVNKGANLYIEGKIKTRSYDDKNGNKRYVTEIIVDGFNSCIQFVGKKSDSNNQVQNDTNFDEQETDDPF